MRSPFELTAKMVTRVADISLLLGRLDGMHLPFQAPAFRRDRRIRNIHGSVAVEGTSLSEDEVGAVLDDKYVWALRSDLVAVQNAAAVYADAKAFNPFRLADLLRAHKRLMDGLAVDAGAFRRSAGGVHGGNRMVQLAVPAGRVPALVADLFRFLTLEKDLPLLITACVLHYELAFIHPFSHGNGWIARFWQMRLLMEHHEAFEWLPVEAIIKSRKREYDRALQASDETGSSTTFIEFSLETIEAGLEALSGQVRSTKETPEERLTVAYTAFVRRDWTRKEYLELHRGISTATASRDLAAGVSTGVLRKSGDKATATYGFVRKP